MLKKPSIILFVFFVLIQTPAFVLTGFPPVDEDKDQIEVSPAASLINKVIPADSKKNKMFGFSAGIHQHTAVIGQFQWDGKAPGAFYIYTREDENSKWTLTKKITDGSLHNEAFFGRSVTVFGDYAAATSELYPGVPGEFERRIHLYARNKGGADNWGLLKIIEAPDPATNQGFAFPEIRLYGDYLVASDIYDSQGGDSSGATHVFYRNKGGNNNWGYLSKIKDSNPKSSDIWGQVRAFKDDILVIHDKEDLGGGVYGHGAIHLYKLNNGNINKIKMIEPHDGANWDSYGIGVDVSGEFLAVGAHMRNENGYIDCGAVYLYQKNKDGKNNWGFYKKLVPKDLRGGDNFGASIGLYDDYLVVSAPKDQNPKGTKCGAMYVFAKDEGGENNWGEVTKYIPSDGHTQMRFAEVLELWGTTALVGCYGNKVNGNASAGSAYFIDVRPMGTIKGVIKPTAARKAGAMWGIQGEDGWYSHNEKVLIPPGKYTLTAQEPEGWKLKKAVRIKVKLNKTKRGKVVLVKE
jgi:hypothetical protein